MTQTCLKCSFRQGLDSKRVRIQDRKRRRCHRKRGIECSISKGRKDEIVSHSFVIEEGVGLSSFCTFGIGGPAKYFCKVTSIDDLRKASQFASENEIKNVMVLGKGSNCLFDDRGFDGLVVVNKMCSVETFPSWKDSKDGNLILRAESGYPFNNLGQMLSIAGWSGLEFATGIPGTVGGAIYMNAGSNARETVQSLLKVEYVTKQGELMMMDPIDPSTFCYRKSPFQSMENFFAIVSGTFSLEANPNAKITAREYMRKRSTSQPLKDKSAGCVFRNPSLMDSGGEVNEAHQLSAGELIDRAGLKGKSCGTALVSPVHANYLVCTERNERSSRDMKELISQIKQRILSETGISLQEEIRIIPYSKE